MECVFSVTYKIMVNGDLSQEFLPTRGLRQGDPLSPYLFLFIQEVFSKLITKAVEDGRITGIKPRRLCPSISHLLFADDTIVFMQVSDQASFHLKDVLNLFTLATGQTINFHKSSVLFSANTPPHLKATVCDSLGVVEAQHDSTYLGLPAVWEKRKMQH